MINSIDKKVLDLDIKPKLAGESENTPAFLLLSKPAYTIWHTLCSIRWGRERFIQRVRNAKHLLNRLATARGARIVGK